MIPCMRRHDRQGSRKIAEKILEDPSVSSGVIWDRAGDGTIKHPKTPYLRHLSRLTPVQEVGAYPGVGSGVTWYSADDGTYYKTSRLLI